MKIETVDAFYLRMPKVLDIGDGSQDALLIRVSAGGFIGWGECEASPLTTIAALVAPMSHSACHPVLDAVTGAELDGPDSIRAIHRQVRARCMDLLQADHALSGIDIALWDLLGRREGAPVWSFLGGENTPKLAYASVLFGDTPEATLATAKQISRTCFKAAKFGWGPIGRGQLSDDRDQLAAVREGLGPDLKLMVDTGCVFGHDVEAAKARIPLMEEFGVTWWEEPFSSGALAEYAELARSTASPLAGGEGAHNSDQARHFVDYAGIKYIQIDAGRVGGITAAREVAVYAQSRGAQYVNHTFTSNLALSASLQPYADCEGFAEVPMAPSALAVALGGVTTPDSSGLIKAPDAPGLGVEISLESLRKYIQDIQIRWNGQLIWGSPERLR